ncbi:hypothetical protein WL30_02750 [Burkholderia ubonensis]|uniref:DUF4123 domain-containing protein n=1 Tax=Burkholderia ubonensis TaxID=101571 RepID=UPI0007591F1E|nr:DUF4123 domain-containing protein [Burkholderia ubonensis]KVO84483.1 hypothetical protein WJ80_15325 [Burkholderia ubonensis]KWA78221.1 hypothetical protein WL30_02750 [Burkholderia ubonensis]KWB15923.1 hypothetical protein WL31_00145 [Burkholderia ubonensis]
MEAFEPVDDGNRESVDSMVSVLRAYFDQQREPRCCLVVDPSQRALPQGDEGAPSFGDQPSAVVAIAHDAFPDDHRPYLIELDLSTSEGTALLAESVRLAFEDRHPDAVAKGLGQRIGGWLASDATPEQIAEYWSNNVLQIDDQGHRCALRFYDARALSLIWPILSDGQKQALLGPVKAWHALDACAKPCVYSSATALRAELELTDGQWRDIRRHGLINRALALHMLTTQRQPRSSEVEIAIASAARAEQHGLADREDKIAFIGHALTWHPYFDRHPSVAHALRQRAPDEFYTAAVGELSEDEIEAIRRGMWYDESVTVSSS